ncbi:sortase [Chloroflexus sp.]|uniref:sortase n=1 Tax=Chloroflexus sp. TaxID=1904827 RepID=UPI002ACEC807|nr:sortase [Chloroflexus sp.]
MLHRFPMLGERFWHLITGRRVAPARRGPWLLGTALMVLGAGLLIYVLVTTLQIEYYRWAARGDSPLPAPQITTSGFRPADARPLPLLPDLAPAAPAASAGDLPPPAAAPAAPAGDLPPPAAPATSTLSAVGSGLLISEPPEPVRAEWVATVDRLVIPAIRVDFKVIEVGWDTIEENGQLISVWQVAEYAVGQHRGSANPGEGDNIVLAGHVGGYGRVFKDLFYLKPGDEVIVYSRGQPYRYIVNERIVVDEEGAPPEQRLANARYIAPTGYEVVTMVTCWPPSGPDKFKQRVIVRALPVKTTDDGAVLPDSTR